MIHEYLDAIEHALGHDRSLARCARQEIEDHLWEAVAADPQQDRIAAQRRATAMFGDPRAIAAQLAAISLARKVRRTGAALIFVAVAVFLTMKVRVAWYAATQCAGGDAAEALGSGLLTSTVMRSGSL